MTAKTLRFRGALYQLQRPTVQDLLELALLLTDHATARAQAAEQVAQQHGLALSPLEPALQTLTQVKALLQKADHKRTRRLAQPAPEAWSQYAEQYDAFAVLVDQLEELLGMLVKETHGTQALPLVWEARVLVRNIDRELDW
jgi:hypothetical protein